MKVGVHLPQWGDHAGRAGVMASAIAAEESGFDSVWVADHIVFPGESKSVYPYRTKGVPFSPDDGFLEATTVLAVIAGCTSRIGLGTSVLVLPMREPLLTAKAFATLDVLSEGRVILAVGAGWWAEEFEALGQRYDSRGQRMEEQIAILKHAWTDGTFSFDGDFYQVKKLTCRPLPVRSGGPPVLVGGMGPAAIRRAATIGDGWHAVGSDLEALEKGKTKLEETAERIGRDPASITTSVSLGAGRSREESRGRLRALAELGVDQVVLNLRAEPTLADEIRAFAAEVLTDLDLSS